MAEVAITYPSNVLVHECRKRPSTACNVEVGKRMSSYAIVNQADGSSVQLAKKLSSNGRWKLLVFSGDLYSPGVLDRLLLFAKEFKDWVQPFSKPWKRQCHLFETVLIHSNARACANVLNLPEIFEHFEKELGWDYEKVFADDPSYDGNSGEVYDRYGIDKEKGCLIVCRPDQHVGWIGGFEDVKGLEEYFSKFLMRKT
ncbi:thioredoxin-like protein, partial [Aspergillus avenaceus]